MSHQHISATLADIAFDQFEITSQRASRFLSGEQIDMFDTSRLSAREWLSITAACDAEASRHG